MVLVWSYTASFPYILSKFWLPILNSKSANIDGVFVIFILFFIKTPFKDLYSQVRPSNFHWKASILPSLAINSAHQLISNLSPYPGARFPEQFLRLCHLVRYPASGFCKYQDKFLLVVGSSFIFVFRTIVLNFCPLFQLTFH